MLSKLLGQSPHLTKTISTETGLEKYEDLLTFLAHHREKAKKRNHDFEAIYEVLELLVLAQLDLERRAIGLPELVREEPEQETVLFSKR